MDPAGGDGGTAKTPPQRKFPEVLPEVSQRGRPGGGMRPFGAKGAGPEGGEE